MAKVRIEDEVVVDAPAEEVWAAIEDPAAHASWHPFVTGITGEHSLGATRRCAVAIGKKTGETSECCIEHEPERRIAWRIEEDSSGFLRMVSDWTAGFGLESRDGGTIVRAESVFQPRNVLVRLMLPMVRRKFHGAQQAILAGLKTSVER
jgi:uncharacterized protein YndB with AHSA1/START domain